MIYIFWTCASEEEGSLVVGALLEKRLIACASLLPGVKSMFRWKGKVESAEEVKVILKSRDEHFEAITQVIRDMGSYEVAEIASVKVEKVSKDYEKWLLGET